MPGVGEQIVTRMLQNLTTLAEINNEYEENKEIWEDLNELK